MTKITIFEAKHVITWISLTSKLKYPEKEENIQFSINSHSCQLRVYMSLIHSTHTFLARRDFPKIFCYIETAPFLAFAGSLLSDNIFYRQWRKERSTYTVPGSLLHTFIQWEGKKEQNPLASSNISARIGFMNWKSPMPFSPIMKPLKKLNQEMVCLTK